MSPNPGDPEPSYTVLVAEDDRAIRESLERLLSLSGYMVVAAGDGAVALEARRTHAVDLVILDVMMPAVDGLTVCRVLRSEGDSVPILMLTALSEPADRVAGLDVGADDYLAKPFDPGELLARVRALIRRSRLGKAIDQNPTMESGGRSGDDVLRVGDMTLDPAARQCWRGDAEVQLSKIEFDLLELLIANVGIVLSRTQIYEQIWDYDFGPDSKNLAVYISYLRRKLDDGRDQGLIQTVRGVGYTIRRPESGRR